MNFAAYYSRAIKYSRSNPDLLLKAMASDPEHQLPNANLRMIAADAMDEAGREREANILRGEDKFHISRYNGNYHTALNSYNHDRELYPHESLHVVRTHPDDLNSAAHGYKQAALWSSDHTDEHGEHHGSFLDNGYGHRDIADLTHDKMNKDVMNFMEENYEHLHPSSTLYTHAGHDLWLSRNGHGTGLFDGEQYGDSAKYLQDEARKYGEQHLELGDDNLIHGH